MRTPSTNSCSSSRRSMSKSPVRRNGHRQYAKYQNSKSRSGSRRSSTGHNGRYRVSKSSSRSFSPRRRRYGSRSRSPTRSRSQSRPRSPHDKRYNTRVKPNQSRCIGVFGLSVLTTQHKIREIFSKFGPIDRIQVVMDAQTGRSRGFCFIYFENLKDAKAAKNACSGMEVDDRRIRVDYSITERSHTPTPGIYMGRSTKKNYDPYKYDNKYDNKYDRHHDYPPRGQRRNSSSEHRYPHRSLHRSERRRHRERSKSHSYSPRYSRH